MNNKCVYRVKDIAACDKMEKKIDFLGKGFRKKGKEDENVQIIEETRRQEVMVKHYEES